MLLDIGDGDTYTMLLDVFGTKYRSGAISAEIRLRDYSCPELRTAEGKRAKEVATALLTQASEVVVDVKGERSFSRYVGWVWVDGLSLGQLLVEAGVARPGRLVG